MEISTQTRLPVLCRHDVELQDCQVSFILFYSSSVLTCQLPSRVLFFLSPVLTSHSL